ncbi:zinc finger protein 1035 [Cottoperca gobio]|uniref:Uncharacterized protein LOC115021111 n=1 Tax=Cottoperca gobio TaxID=56716 RepID=A0A6J2RA20_COTGO|nr:uncharacterized protein LOC115021111 [Cottoperca gobio]XP_029307140.1 uncharacterized protein LOC115021111 [Cottoperca gobio]
MAQGWDSYFHNLPPLSSDPSTLRRTSESEGSLPQHIENFIGHHDFPGTVASNEAPATNSNFDTDNYSSLSMENPSSDCLYQRYCKETPWQTDVEQMEKDYLPRSGNSDISDFATEGLSTSFATDLQDLKQDCGMLASSLTEDYSDVSSCSDADAGETRPSCKFIASNSVPKSATTKPSSSEWLFTDAGKMMLPTESLCPNMSETNVNLSSPSNGIAGENVVERAQDKMEKTVKSYTGQNQSSTTSNMVTTKGSKTVKGRNDCGGCPDQKQKEAVERDLTRGNNSNISISGLANLTGDGIEYPDGNEEERIPASAPNIMTLDNVQDHSDEKVLRKEIKESIDHNPNSTDGQNENIIQSNTSQSSEQPDCKDSAHKLEECTSTSKGNRRDVESCLPLSEHQSYESVASDNFPIDTSDKNEQDVASPIESCLQPNGSSKDINPCFKKEWTSPSDKTNATSSPDQQQTLHQSPVALEPGCQNGGFAECARESLEELDTSAESALGMMYGEPLSREDSLCDADGTQLDTSVARPDHNSMNNSEGQETQLNSTRKRLQPVVILKISESVNGTSNSYHCADCQDTTHNVDHLIEHYHCCHSVHNFQFCKTCNLYLMQNKQTEKHVCCVTKDSPQLSSDFSLTKKRKQDFNKCGLAFPKPYIKKMRPLTGKTPYKCNGCGLYFTQSSSLLRHMRGRCKQLKLPVTNAVIKETKTPPLKDLVQDKPYPNLPECYVKLVDISKTHLCSFCGKSFLTAVKAKKHFYSIHKGKSLVVSSSQSTTKDSGEKTPKVENDTQGKYKCPLCPRLFKYSYNRTRHLRDCVRHSISGGKDKISGKYRCPLCEVTFTLPCNRYRHIKATCLRECLARLAKERTKTKDIEQKTQSKKNVPKKQPMDLEQKKQALKTVPRYKCNLCPAVFCHGSGKYRHMKKHEVFKLTGKMFRYRNSVSPTMSKPEISSSAKAKESKDTSKSTGANGSRALSCTLCGTCFNTPQSLKKHECNHRGERPYHCLQCGKRFKKRAYLIDHKKSVHQRRIQCMVCRMILPTIGELIQHRSSHLKRGKLQCPDCNLQFQYPAHLLRHLERHKNRERKKILLEERPALKPQQSLNPVQQSEPKQLQCSLCKEVFNDARKLRKHSLSHISGSSSNQCPFCKRNSNNRRNLLRHMVKHTGDKAFSCTGCGKQFYRELYLQLHREKCLPAQTRHLVTLDSVTKTKGPHNCSYCPRTFCKKIRLKNHHRGHKTNTLRLCSRCGQYFGFRKLDQHQRNCKETTELNTGLSSNDDVCKSTSQTIQKVRKMPLKSNATNMLYFKCSHCTQRFRYRSLLLRHLVSHTGVQPFACMHCGHRYASHSMCLQHEAFCDGVYEEGKSNVKGAAATQLTKTLTLKKAAQKPQTEGEADYKCKFCTKTFMKSRSLRRHILTHNEVKPYRCKACDSCFSRYDHLKVHQTRCRGKKTRLEVCIPKISLDYVGKGWQNKYGMEHTVKQETFECKVCSRSFPTQSKLSRHVTMFHVTKVFKCTCCGSSFVHETSLKKHRKMKKCRKPSNEANASLPLETNPPTENVTNSLKRMRNRIIQRIQPYLNKKYKYACSYCPRVFQNSWQLGVHNRLHTGERPYACDDCGQRFIRKDYVKRHSVKCSKKLILTSRLSKSTGCQSPQSTSESPPKGFSCAYCSSRFLLFSQLQEHFLNAHKLETKAPSVSTAPLQHHLSNILNVKEEPLDESCDKQFSDAANVICNLDTAFKSEVSTPFFCQECNMSFTNKAGLTGHLRVHAREFPFSCKTCKKGFWNKSLLRNHNRKCRYGHISEKSKTQQLEVPLKAEIDFVLNDSVLVFKEASKSTGTGVLQTNFSCKDELIDDNQVQSSSSKDKKAVQYQCSECDQSFTDGLMLISHLEDHGREEQAKKHNACIECGQVFASYGSLVRHMKLHDIDRKLSCPDCSKMFYTLSEVETHRTCHDPSRPFTCKLCNHRFWTSPSLCSHYREEHPDDVFSCRFCDKAYSVKKSLARHYRRWHLKEQRDLVKEKSRAEKPSSSQFSTTGESDGDDDSNSDSAPYFPCHVCGKTFPTSESLEDHQRCHLGEKPHECAECGRCFFQASQLQQHQRMHKSEFQCQACGRGFVSLFALRKHKHTHGKSRPYRCPKCDFSFTGTLQLAEHMSIHREESFPCDICNLVFLSKSSRAEHRKSHSKSGDLPPPSISRKEHETSALLSESSSVSPKELKYRCGVCGERFGDPEKLSEHGCTAAKERPYSCSDCDKHFLHASHLKKHRATHQLPWSGSEYPCNQCNNSFSSSQLFLSHLKSHGTEIKPSTEVKALSNGFKCPVCHQCFTSATELISHFPKHPDGPSKTSKTAFPSRSKLDEHEHCSHQKHATMQAECSNALSKTSPPTHYQAAGEEEEIDVTGEELYNCPVCSMRFSSKSGLLEHQNKLHRIDGPFKCELCGKTFARKSYLSKHERRHHQKNMAQSAKNAFKCSQCYDLFNTAQDLSLHMRFHAEKEVGEYRCDMCYKSFRKWHNLKQHQESHVGQVVYECTECDKAFAFPHLLEKHQQTHAGSSQ